MKKITIRTYAVLAMISCFSLFSMAQNAEVPNKQKSVNQLATLQEHNEMKLPSEEAFGSVTQRSCGCDVSNLLPDGDFESLLPITSGLGINCACAGSSVCVGHEPRDKCTNSLWIDDLWDHTLGTSAGNFLIVDGGNGSVWSETVPVTAGQDYVFSFWEIREVSDNNFGNNSTQNFDLRVNGATIASFNTASAPEDEWTQYCTTWTSTFSSGSATVEIVQTSGTGYNDYGIDDIEFGECRVDCEVPQLNDYFSYFNSQKECSLYEFFAVELNGDLCYEWYVNGDLVGIDNILSYVFEADGVYEVCLRIYCCENEEVPDVVYCETVFVDCQEDRCGCEIQDQLNNGDFENTSIPVSSGLPINCSCSTGSVCVGHEPRDKCGNSLWINDLWDHTFGTSAGHFLIVDGANGAVWEDHVSVIAGSTYIFEFWEIREVSDNTWGNNSTQTFDIVIDGNVIASFNTASAPEDEWTLYCAEWVAPYSSSNAGIEIRQTSGSGYNDYGIDDIQFGRCAGTVGSGGFEEKADIQEQTPVNLELYPNPAVNNITLEWNDNVSINEVSIYSADGKIVKTLTVSTEGRLTIDVSDLNEGIYLLKTDANNIERFVIKK